MIKVEHIFCERPEKGAIYQNDQYNEALYKRKIHSKKEKYFYFNTLLHLFYVFMKRKLYYLNGVKKK